jgi:hypothetical protein
VKDKIISDLEAVRIALCFPKNTRAKLSPLKPVGEATFKGDNMPACWSVNEFFTKGERYPVYDHDGGNFVIGSDGVGKKIASAAWSKIKWY